MNCKKIIKHILETKGCSLEGDIISCNDCVLNQKCDEIIIYVTSNPNVGNMDEESDRLLYEHVKKEYPNES